jgi:hypothetical protein
LYQLERERLIDWLHSFQGRWTGGLNWLGTHSAQIEGRWRFSHQIIMTIVDSKFCFRSFDDSFYFQRLTLIDICCGPPVAC